jgi:hypothetical protein
MPRRFFCMRGHRIIRNSALVGVLVAAASLSFSSTANASDTNCTYGSSGGNVYTCMSVNGSGTHINFATAGTAPQLSAATVDVGIVYTQTDTLLVGSGFKHLAVGQEINIFWSPDAIEPAGDYCAYTYQNSLSDLISVVCVDVHS